MTDPRLARWQLRKNGELLLRSTPPPPGAPLQAVESSTWSDGWASLYSVRPDLRPVLEHEETFPRERLRERLGAFVDADREHVLVAPLHRHPDAVGVGAACVGGPGAAVADYAVRLVDDDVFPVEELFVLDEPAGTILLVDEDADERPGELLLQRYRWPELDD